MVRGDAWGVGTHGRPWLGSLFNEPNGMLALDAQRSSSSGFATLASQHAGPMPDTRSPSLRTTAPSGSAVRALVEAPGAPSRGGVDRQPPVQR